MKLQLSFVRMARFFLQIVFFLTGFLSSLSALDPSTEIQNYLKKSWTRENGLVQNTVLTIEQTQDGFIWIGTPSGLLRFDGVQFKLFTTHNTPALLNDRILTLHEDVYQRLWIGTDGGGLCYLQNSAWRYFSTADGLSNDHIRTIISDWNGQVWIGTDYGLNHYTADAFTSYTSRDRLSDNVITSLAIDSRGYVWIGTLRGGLIQFQNKVVRVYGYQQGLKDEAVMVLLADRQDNIWIGTLHGLYFMDNGNGQIQFIRGTAYTPITSIVEDATGIIWIATMADGLKRLEVGKFESTAGPDGFPADYLHTLHCDHDNNLWIGSDAAGLFQIQDARVKNITVRNGLPEMAVTTVLQDRKGDLWVGMNSEGVCQLKAGKVIKVWNTSSGLSSNRVSALWENSGGGLWVGTRDQGLNFIKNNSVKILNMSAGLTSNLITCFLEDQAGTLWIGTDRGVHHLLSSDPASLQLIGPASHQVQTLLLGKEGQLYIGTREGLFIYQENSLQQVAPESELAGLQIESLYEDDHNILWIGTAGRGLFCLNGDSLWNWDTNHGLPDNHIFSICEDDSGFLWFSSYQGVFRIRQDDLVNFSAGKSEYIFAAWFDESDGMASSLCSSDGNPAVWKSTTSQLYYPTAAGVVVFDPLTVSLPPDPSGIIIENVLLEGQPVTQTDPLSFSFPLNHLSLQFTVPEFYSPRKLSIFYRLIGMDTTWIRMPESEKRQVDFFNLKPGKYQASILAVNQTGFSPGNAAILPFEIEIPFYRNSFFLTFLFLFFLAGGAGMIFVRHRKAIQRKLNKYQTSTLDPQRAEELIPKLLRLMEQDKIYLQPNLSLKHLSQLLKIHPNHLSRIINQRFEMSFNDFINRYRINEAKQLLLQVDEEKRNILQIMYDTGFYSKSVFNTAFKKFTGMTPSEFKRRHHLPADE